MERLIGTYTEGVEGPLLFVIGGMHGNEPAGIHALENLFSLLNTEHSRNPGFEFKGKLVGLRGNLQAIRSEKRFLERDLNRSWLSESIRTLKLKDTESLYAEDRELVELLNFIELEIALSKPSEVYLLDIHTTTASGGIFSIPNGSKKSLDLAKALHAPVIDGMIDGIKGTSLHYFSEQYWDVPMTSVVFEAGQHQDELSENRAIAAIVNCLRELGCVKATDVENHHDQILIQYAKGLPRVSRLCYTHAISPEDNFVMKPGFENFQPIEKETILASDIKGEIRAQTSGLILMPLYQKQGEDGFFVIEIVEP